MVPHDHSHAYTPHFDEVTTDIRKGLPFASLCTLTLSVPVRELDRSADFHGHVLNLRGISRESRSKGVR
jgi:hypothetical protein